MSESKTTKLPIEVRLRHQRMKYNEASRRLAQAQKVFDDVMRKLNSLEEEEHNARI